MPLKAVIFDMDGVLSQTQKLHAKTQSEVLMEETGKKMKPEEITEKYAGTESGTFFEEEADSERPEKMHSQKQDRLYELVEEQGVDPVAGALQLVESLEGEFVLGVASGSQTDFIEKVLSSLCIKEKFDSFTSASEVENGKPAPDVYLKEAERLGVKPENCIVIEDSSAGMKSANSAKMASIGLSENECPADFSVSSLKDFNPEVLEKFYEKA